MKYEVRRPIEDDRPYLDNLLIEDYKKSGIHDKPPLTERQMRTYAEKAWVAYNEQEMPEAIVIAGKWNYKTAAPYSRLPEAGLKLLGKAGFFRGQTGIYVMSAVDYEEGGALTALVDHTEILEPKTGAVHVPLLRKELADKAFLLGRGFTEGKEGLDHLTWRPPEETVETILMTRKK